MANRFGSAVALACATALFLPSGLQARTIQPVRPINLVRPDVSVLANLRQIVTIGSTVDPLNGDQNPYGLTIAPVSAGLFTAGDLVVCNFNNAANVQGTGTTIVGLHPTPGSTPYRVAQFGALKGCAAMALAPDDTIWAAALGANDNPIIGSDGTLFTTLKGWFSGPWGQAFSSTAGIDSSGGAFYESNARVNGSIIRIGLTNSGFTFDTIVSGFELNHGVPGNILAPSGLTYDWGRDILYIADGNNNAIYSISSPGQVHPGGITFSHGVFSGPDASHAKTLFIGRQLFKPISIAMLFNGNLVVGNTGNNNLVELSPSGHVLSIKQLDHGISGALFGIVASGTNAQNTKIYFNDDNDNTVKVLEH